MAAVNVQVLRWRLKCTTAFALLRGLRQSVDRLHWTTRRQGIVWAVSAGVAAVKSCTGGHPKRQARQFREAPYPKGVRTTALGPSPDLADGPLLPSCRC